VLPHPPYSPDLALSVAHPFSQIKNAIRSRKFQDGDKITVEMKAWLRQTLGNFYQRGMQAFVPRWHNAIKNYVFK
jgi:histone-lysine N-methyltransferase SETMAR